MRDFRVKWGILEEKLHFLLVKWGIFVVKMRGCQVKVGILEEKMPDFWVECLLVFFFL